MITRKHFKAIAEIVKNNSCWVENAYPKYIAKDLADYFATQNPKFDQKRFFKACGL